MIALTTTACTACFLPVHPNATVRPLPQYPMSWAFVDGGGANGLNFDSSRSGYYPQLVAWHGMILNTWYEENGDAVTQIRVARMDPDHPAEGWTLLDGDGADGINRDAARPATWSRLVVFDDRLYCYWYEATADGGTAIRIARFGGTAASPVWTYVDGTIAHGLRYAAGDFADYATVEPFNGKLYAAWRETDGTQAYQIRVAVFNGTVSSPSWHFVDGGGSIGINRDPTVDAYYPKLAAFNGALYIAWYEKNGTGRPLRAAVYNGTDDAPKWTLIDGGGNAGLSYNPDVNSPGPQIFAADNALFATWYEQGGDRIGHIRMARFSGSGADGSWQFLDGGTADGMNRDPMENAWWPRATVLNGIVFVAWTEYSDSDNYRIHVDAFKPNIEIWYNADPNSADTGTGTTDATSIGAFETYLNYVPTENAEYPHMTSLDGHVYLTFAERHNGAYQVRVVVGEHP